MGDARWNPPVEWDRLGEQLDRLVTVEMRPTRGSVPAGLVIPLYEVCRAATGAPLTTTAAARLRVTAGKPVAVVTGAGVSPQLCGGETDGPPGAVALAAALRRGVGADPVIITEKSHAPAVRRAAAVLDPGLPVRLFPAGKPVAAGLAAENLLDEWEPAAVVFVERDGANVEGRYHGVRGNSRPRGAVARADLLAAAARRRGIVTIGIGDGGNEAGFGGVREQIRNLFPGRGACDDDCPSGRVTAVETDVCVAASVSNWGAYAVVAALAALTGDLTLIPDATTERALVEACVDAGARDGASGLATVSVDGIPQEGHGAMLNLLRVLVAVTMNQSGAFPPVLGEV
jgi:hypothetical protein